MNTLIIRTLPLALLVASLAATELCHADEVPVLKVMTFNIRYGTAPDGENAWPNRRQLVFETLRQAEADVIGVQEALPMQLDELAEEFPQYVALGAGREADGGGEYSSILLRRNRFDVVESGTFWLSETPEDPGSKSYGNQLPRICVWARLFDRQASKRFFIFNTHWDHQSQAARLASGMQIAQKYDDRSFSDEPAIVTGDFNAGEDNEALKPFQQMGLQDSFRVLHPDADQVGTFHGFQGTTEGEKIDAIFVSPAWNVQSAEIVHQHENNRYPSDHFPVTATLVYGSDSE